MDIGIILFLAIFIIGIIIKLYTTVNHLYRITLGVKVFKSIYSLPTYCNSTHEVLATDVLKYALAIYQFQYSGIGLCRCLDIAKRAYGIDCDIKNSALFTSYNEETIKRFNGNCKCTYWWATCDWRSRYKFMIYLIETQNIIKENAYIECGNPPK